MAEKRDDNLERLTSTIQKMLDGNPAILVGSGGSIPHGLPSMNELADEIKRNLQNKYQNNDDWNAFISELEKTSNLEKSLDNIQLNDDIHHDLIWAVWSIVNQKDITAKNSFLSQSSKPPIADILNKFIQQAGITNIITTNYDRIIEYAIDFADGKCCTGFSDGYIRKFRKFNHFPFTTAKRTVNLYKVHGSIDWFKHRKNQTLNSLPFFEKKMLGDTFFPQIITPGNSKYKETHLDPFRTVISKADDVLRNSCAYLCIGYGFNDEHIQPIIIDENRNKKKPIVIVVKEITPKIKNLFLSGTSENCLLISEASKGSSLVNFPGNEAINFHENYWQVGDFYRLWFE